MSDGGSPGGSPRPAGVQYNARGGTSRLWYNGTKRQHALRQPGSGALVLPLR
jgi:hypothetical protein